MLARRLWLLAALGAACRRPDESSELLPINLGAWRRLAVEYVPAEEYPEPYKRQGLKRARRAIYQGSVRVTATVYEFGAPAVAFELVQKWRPRPRTTVFHQGPYLVVLESASGDVEALNRLAGELEGALPK